MLNLTIKQLAELTRGQLAFGPMPPLDGDLQEVARLLPSGEQVCKGDVVAIGGTLGRCHEGFSEIAFMQGALGVICSQGVTPWDGGFALRVPCVRTALTELACWKRQRFPGLLIAVVDDADPSPWMSRMTAACCRTTERSPHAMDLLWQLLQLDERSPIEFIHVCLPNCCERSINIAKPDVIVVAPPRADELDEFTAAGVLPESVVLDVGLRMLRSVVSQQTQVIAPASHAPWQALAQSHGAALELYDACSPDGPIDILQQAIQQNAN